MEAIQAVIMAFNVFVSYSTRDFQVVTALREQLHATSATVYVAEYA